ncbi:hypothetical protein ERTO105960_06420 [Erysipelothrix tonsillarum]
MRRRQYSYLFFMGSILLIESAFWYIKGQPMNLKTMGLGIIYYRSLLFAFSARSAYRYVKDYLITESKISLGIGSLAGLLGALQIVMLIQAI